MAQAIQATTQTPVLGFFTQIKDVFVQKMIALTETNSRATRVRELYEMSDEQLAKLGLTRDNIVSHVFTDYI